MIDHERLRLDQPLPVGSAGTKSTGWWGLWTLIITEASLFGYLLLSYFYLYSQSSMPWPPEGHPKLLVPGINTVVLLSSSVFVWLSELCLKKRRIKLAMLPMLVAIILGAIFVGVQVNEWSQKSYSMTSSQYGSLYFTVTGFHMAHVVVGLVILSLLMLWTGLGYFDDKRRTAMTLGGMYWHFVDVVWIFIFSSLYLVPYLPVK